jgi:rod shape-determining protein MreD
VLAGIIHSPWVRVPLVVFLVLAIQTGIVADIRPLDATPDLMLLLAIVSGLAVGPERGAIVGAAIGLAFDLVLTTPLGLSALVYGAAAFAVGLLSTGTIKATRWIPVIAVAATSAAAVVVYAILASLFGVAGAFTVHLFADVLVVTSVNALLALPALAVMRWALQADDRRI